MINPGLQNKPNTTRYVFCQTSLTDVTCSSCPLVLRWLKWSITNVLQNTSLPDGHMPISVSTSSLLPSMSTRVTAYLVERRYLLQFCFVLLLSVHISVYFFSCVVLLLSVHISVYFFSCVVLLLSVHYFCILLQFFCLLLSVHFSVYFFSSFALTAIRTNVCYLLQFFCSDSYPYIFLLSSSVFLFWQLSVHFSVIFFSSFALAAFRTFFCILLPFVCSDSYPYIFLLSSSVILFW